MISKRIHCTAKNDNFKRLANYIEDASHEGEKALVNWCAGAWVGDDYELAIQEVLDTQVLNTRTTKEKTYHLVVSFRTEDEGMLSNEDFKRIEERFAKALGFDEHQRHCGVHINTDNMHMHIAYNMIHPEKLTRHEPYRDYQIRDRVCREIEMEYNLSCDNGIDQANSEYKLSDKSAKKESVTGEESFETFTLNHHDQIMEELQKANSWEDVHSVFAKYGIELKKHGNGLVLKNNKGKQAIKASKFDRTISYQKLVKTFGEFTPKKNNLKAQVWFDKKPIHKNAERDKLWQDFLKQSALTKNNASEELKHEIAQIKEKYLEKEKRIILAPIGNKSRSDLLKAKRNDEALEINNLRIQHAKNTKEKTNWLCFLQEKAQNGNETAHKILLSKNTEENTQKDHSMENLIEKTKLLEQKKAILSNNTISNQSKNTLINKLYLEKVTKEDFTYKIGRNGRVIFSTPHGKIVDDGREISFSKGAKDIALDYFAIKHGKKKFTPKEKEKFIKNQISFKDIKDMQQQKKQEIGR